MGKFVVFGPKGDRAAEWRFFPSAKIRRQYPNADLVKVGMDMQEGEVVALTPNSQKMLDSRLVIEVAEGRVELLDFQTNWQVSELRGAIVWDICRIVEEWASND